MDFYMCFVYFFVVWIHNKKNLSIKKRSIPFDSVIPLTETHPKERIQKKDAKYTKMFIVTSQKIPKKNRKQQRCLRLGKALQMMAQPLNGSPYIH